MNASSTILDSFHPPMGCDIRPPFSNLLNSETSLSKHPRSYAEPNRTNQINRWENIIKSFDYAFQPIVNLHTGETIGVEALLRRFEEAGFQQIQDVFDRAYAEGVLHSLELKLREKAIVKFLELKLTRQPTLFINLFLNVDNRILFMPDFVPGHTREIAARHHLDPHVLCFEVSEKHDFHNRESQTLSIMSLYKDQNYQIALDDFGTGYSGLQMLYFAQPDYIKIDRFFIASLDLDKRKQIFVRKILKLSKVLGIKTIAEGIETDGEFLIARDIGCDYGQGYFIQKPTTDTDEILERYGHLERVMVRETREVAPDQNLVNGFMETRRALPLYDEQGSGYTPVTECFQVFRQNRDQTYVPVVGRRGEPVGLVLERDLKQYVYSPFGKDLLQKRKAESSLKSFLCPCPICDVSTPLQDIVEMFTAASESEGILITERGVYKGFLTARAVLQIIHEKTVAAARDENPLTRLPGNLAIERYIAQALEDPQTNHVFAYFDFDNFKPFNDTYGFRQGDRIILLFAELLRGLKEKTGAFIGHVGGDDFFAGCSLPGETPDTFLAELQSLMDAFRERVKSFYPASALATGGIQGFDRDGKERHFPIMTVSAGMLHQPAHAKNISMDRLILLIADIKKRAKKADRAVVFTVFDFAKSLPGETTSDGRTSP